VCGKKFELRPKIAAAKEKSMSGVHTGLGTAYWTRLAARLLSLAASGVFLLIIFLAVTNEDGVQPRALPVLVLLGLTILASWAAWRWEMAGGSLTVAGAAGLGLAAYSAASSFGPGAWAFLAPLIYGLPFLAAGVLFLLGSQLRRSTTG
jgi:hypothetical protein